MLLLLLQSLRDAEEQSDGVTRCLRLGMAGNPAWLFADFGDAASQSGIRQRPPTCAKARLVIDPCSWS